MFTFTPASVVGILIPILGYVTRADQMTPESSFQGPVHKCSLAYSGDVSSQTASSTWSCETPYDAPMNFVQVSFDINIADAPVGKGQAWFNASSLIQDRCGATQVASKELYSDSQVKMDVGKCFEISLISNNIPCLTSVATPLTRQSDAFLTCLRDTPKPIEAPANVTVSKRASDFDSFPFTSGTCTGVASGIAASTLSASYYNSWTYSPSWYAGWEVILYSNSDDLRYFSTVNGVDSGYSYVNYNNAGKCFSKATTSSAYGYTWTSLKHTVLCTNLIYSCTYQMIRNTYPFGLSSATSLSAGTCRAAGTYRTHTDGNDYCCLISSTSQSGLTIFYNYYAEKNAYGFYCPLGYLYKSAPPSVSAPSPSIPPSSYATSSAAAQIYQAPTTTSAVFAAAPAPTTAAAAASPTVVTIIVKPNGGSGLKDMQYFGLGGILAMIPAFVL